VENAGPGSRGAQPRSQGLFPGRGKDPGTEVAGVHGLGIRAPGVWKTRGLVEDVGSSGKRGVWWKTKGLVENAKNFPH